ncbi:MAG: DUF4922 domain-containing protein [Muribaculaceae bacterium]|nr:DUF4922 domain-containing protein [Muribaculaceae bacterium]
MTAEDYSGRVDELFERQLRDWDTVRDNYAALDGACLRTLELDDALIVLQHNPERRRSAAARLDDTSQPCFLCRDGQPAEQEAIVWADRYKIQVNPYPIFPRHLTIASLDHVAQSLASPTRIADMLALARALPQYVVFYNGADCGASAPHHFHFQAGIKGLMPLCDEVSDPVMWPYETRLEGNSTGFVGCTRCQGRLLFYIHTNNEPQAAIYFARLYIAMLGVNEHGREPSLNLLCWVDGDDYHLLLVPRAKHRPACFGTGRGKLLVSPASVEMGGLWALPVQDDYDTLTAQQVSDIYNEVCIDNATAVAIIDHFLTTEKTLPL